MKTEMKTGWIGLTGMDWNGMTRINGTDWNRLVVWTRVDRLASDGWIQELELEMKTRNLQMNKFVIKMQK